MVEMLIMRHKMQGIPLYRGLSLELFLLSRGFTQLMAFCLLYDRWVYHSDLSGSIIIWFVCSRLGIAFLTIAKVALMIVMLLTVLHKCILECYNGKKVFELLQA